MPYEERKRCFILGAGFSKPFGLPLASDLMRLTWDKLPQRELNSTAYSGYREFLKHCFPASNFEQDFPDFEEVLATLDDWIAYESSFAERVSTEPPSQDNLHKSLKYCLFEVLTGLLVASRDTSALDRFMSELDPRSDSIITFNWDYLVEDSAQRQGIEFSHDRVHDGIQIAKPHGSLTWIETSRTKFREKTSGDCFARPEKYEELCALDSFVVRPKNLSDTYARIAPFWDELALVWPSAAKSYTSPWIKSQWNLAYRLARGASEINVLGFSFPQADRRARTLLQAATWNKTALPHLRLVVGPICLEAASQVCSRVEGCAPVPPTLVREDWRDWVASTLTD